MTIFTDLLNKYVARRLDKRLKRDDSKDTIKYKKDIAGEVGLSESVFSQYLTGRKVPAGETGIALARVLGLDDDERTTFLEALRVALNEIKETKNSHKGILDVHSRLADDIFEEYICSAKNRVWILDTWLVNPLRYNDAFAQLAENLHNKSDVSIRVLLLNPSSPAARQRSRDLWISRRITDDRKLEKIEQVVPDMIKSCRREFTLLSDLVGIQMDVRYNNYMPPFTAHICDNRAFVGFFIHGGQSDLAPHLEVLLEAQGQSTDFGGMVLREFDILWASAAPAPNEESFS